MEPRRRFRFLKELSEGAFGKVYMAEMITGDNFRSIVAIKLLHGKWLGHEEIVQRSRDEARVLGLLHHRNIIRVEDLTSINGQCAVVMEYLDGVDCKTLVNWCRERGQHIPYKVVFEIVAAVGSALEAAYNQTPLQGGEALHLIHRDIKPSNVMVTKAGDVKVLDFGTAQARFDEREAHTQALAFGSAAYMAPERLLGDPDAPSGDVFSLGVTLYEILSHQSFGKVHIRPEKYEKELDARLSALVLPELDAERAAQIKQVLRLLLAYDTADRPTARQVVDLMEALADEVHDGSMRRFSREVVSPCRDALNPHQNPDDPLNGSTLFEDRTSGGRGLEGLVTSGDAPVDGGIEAALAAAPSAAAPSDAAPFAAAPSDAAPSDGAPSAAAPSARNTLTVGDLEGEDATWVEDAARSPFTVPPGLAAADTPPELIDDNFDDELEDPAEPAPGYLSSQPTMLPDEDWDGPQAPASLVDPLAGRDPQADAPAVAPPQAEIAGPVPAEPAVAPNEAEPVAAVDEHAVVPPVAPMDEAAPPPPVARAAVPRLGSSEPAAPPRPAPVAKGKKSSGGGKLVVALVALVVIGVVVAGGGLAVAWSMGLLGGGPTAPEVPELPADPPPETAARGVPGGRVEVGPMDGTNGALSLVLDPEGAGAVALSSVTGFKQDWDGTGRLDLVGLPPGTYKTKVSPASGSALRGTLEVKAGLTCSYVFPTTGGESEWTAQGCE